MGLALVRSIVQLSGGRLGVKSKKGEGSCFWVELPFAIVRSALVEKDCQVLTFRRSGQTGCGEAQTTGWHYRGSSSDGSPKHGPDDHKHAELRYGGRFIRANTPDTTGEYLIYAYRLFLLSHEPAE